MRIIFIILTFSLAFVEHDSNMKNSCDAAINTVLVITLNYLDHKNDIGLTKNIKFKYRECSIEWNDVRFLKWKINNLMDTVINE